MKCCEKPEIIVEQKGRQWYYFCLNKGCNFGSKDVYASEEAAKAALQKYLSFVPIREKFYPGAPIKAKKAKKEKNIINWNESLRPIIRHTTTYNIFLSDLMIEKCGLPINYVLRSSSPIQEDRGPFLYLYFYNEESEIPEDLLENIWIPKKTGKKAKKYKPMNGFNIEVSELFQDLGFKYFPTSELPYTMDVKNKRKMIIDLNELYKVNRPTKVKPKKYFPEILEMKD